jgi:hypothetical protein
MSSLRRRAGLRVWGWCLSALCLTALAAAAVPSDDESLFAPTAAFQAKGRRDPFVQPPAGMLHNVMTRVDITVLRLTGVIQHPQRSVALFATTTGPRFGYLLKGGKLYGENQRPVPGVTGQVLDRDQAVLTQGDKRMVYRLR